MAWDKHLLIDGYNILHAWPDLRSALMREAEAARDQLAERVRVIHDMESVRVTVVFDGAGPSVDVVRPTEELHFSIVYAPADLSADGLIEQLVSASKTPQSLYVATRDNFIGSIVRASGAVLLSPDGLLEWVEQCERAQARAVADQQQDARKQWKKGRRWKG